MKSAAMKPAGGGRPDVVQGDHVYYHHPEHGIQTGEVAAVGADGFQAHHKRGAGGVDAVPWARFQGHKLRKQRKFVVVDRGEDGAICEDEGGQRVFLRGQSVDGERFGKAHPAADALQSAPADGPTPLTAQEQLHTIALELGRAQLETAHMLVLAMDRMTSTVAAQNARLDQLIALQVAVLNTPGVPYDPTPHLVLQGHAQAGSSAGAAGAGT